MDDEIINELAKNGYSPLVVRLNEEKKAAEGAMKKIEDYQKMLKQGFSIEQYRDIQETLKVFEKLTGAKMTKDPFAPDKTEKGLDKWVKEKLGILNKHADISVTGPTESDKEREQAEADAKEAWRDMAISSAVEINDAIFDIIKNSQQAELDHKLAMLDKQREAELANKNLTEEQKLAIENRYNEKAKKLKQEAFRKKKAADIVQATINAALAITKTFAEYGFTPVGWAAAIGQGISSATQIALIASQPMPEFSKGGFTDPGMPDEPAGIVHRGEYVVPSEVLKSNTGRLFVNQLERLRQRLPALRSGDMLQALSSLPGYANGGYTGSTPTKGSRTDNLMKNNGHEVNELLEKTLKSNEMLIDILKSGIRADVSLRGRNGLLDKLNENNQTISNSRI